MISAAVNFLHEKGEVRCRSRNRSPAKRVHFRGQRICIRDASRSHGLQFVKSRCQQWELQMIRFVMLITISVIAASIIPEPIYAQTSPPSTEAPMTGIKPDRTVADKTSWRAMREKEAALKQKRSECRKQAKIQKVSLLKRQRFIHECMSR